MGSSLAATQNISTSNRPSRDSINSTLTRLQMGRFDSLSTLGLVFHVCDTNKLATNRYCYFQFVVRFGGKLDKPFIRYIPSKFSHASQIYSFFLFSEDTVCFRQRMCSHYKSSLLPITSNTKHSDIYGGNE